MQFDIQMATVGVRIPRPTVIIYNAFLISSATPSARVPKTT